MKKNVFDQEEMDQGKTLSHSAMNEILELAKTPSVGSFQQALRIYENENELHHDAFD